MAESNQRDLVLGDDEYALVQDSTKGHIIVYRGPTKASLSTTDVPVRHNPQSGRYEACALTEAIQQSVIAPEGSYIVLTNPASPGGASHPPSGPSQRVPLDRGRKIVISGPASFALWPGQTAKVIAGHPLRSNQYIVARVYNDVAASENWGQGVLRPVASGGVEPGAAAPVPPRRTFVMGQTFVIKGTEASFFIPPTGIEVAPDEEGNYVREAVTLERLEYALLLSENGAKRFVHGPDVVFPEPTEAFVEKDGVRKFSMYELNDDMGVHVKVIAAYEEGGRAYRVGEELFITGAEQRIYCPREEHAVIKYGDETRVFGVVIPRGEARYVLNKESGEVELIAGPRIFLADPRKQVIVRRPLTATQAEDWFPGSVDAQRHNESLRAQSALDAGVAAAERAAASVGLENYSGRTAVRRSAGDTFNRRGEFKPPRTITLDPRFEGAVHIAPWPGYAVLVVGKQGKRRVVVGPDSTMLAFDETLQVLTLSTGKPKNTDKLVRAAYLAVANNQVSDIVRVTTRDMVDANISVSYRVNFVGETEDERLRWFSVQNYVKILCDHLRSLLRGACKAVGIEELMASSAKIVRDTVLGAKDAATAKRPGRSFDENGMQVYDVEILGVSISDAEIATSLKEAQHKAVSAALMIGAEEEALKIQKRREEVARELAREGEKTAAMLAEIEQGKYLRSLIADLEGLMTKAKIEQERQRQEVLREAHATHVAESGLARAKAQNDLDETEARRDLDRELSRIKAESEAYVAKFGAISPQFVAALEGFGQNMSAVEVAKALGPLTLLGGKSVQEILQQVLKGTNLEAGVHAAAKALHAGGNGAAAGNA